jgi:hypothetical protein
MRRNIVLGTLAVLAIGAVGVVWLTRSPAQQPLQNLNARQTVDGAGPSLPLSQVVLFSSGVGYFQREGEVEGNARVDLQFPIGDVNDLLKSMVLQDMGKGKVGAISYDGQDPIEKTLRSFAVDLTGNPTIGQVLNQARGEKVEVVMQTTAANQPGTLTGTVMGMESQTEPVGPGTAREVHMLNLNCAEGMRCLNLTEVQRIRFLNARLDAELKRALEVLASSHDSLKKQVSLSFKGDGKRKVRVGYVAENPIWKTSYRLSVDGKTNLQAWAAVENVTDDDWNDVRVVLVSGRPISFQMDLYPPLYVPRPTVEPERFASLRPPTYNGALTNERAVAGMPGPSPFTQFTGIGGLGIGGLGIGGLPAGGGGALGALGGAGGFGGGGNNTGFGGGGNNTGFGGGVTGFGMQGNWNRYQGQLARNQIGAPMGAMQDEDETVVPQNRRLTYEQWQERQKERMNTRNKDLDDAKQAGAKIANLDPHQSIASAAAGEEIGSAFRYVIQDKVSLPRQKSALLPLLDKEVTGTRVSIFNEAVHSKFPLLGLRFKNSSGQPLTQGPITVFEGGSYAGDARMPDLQPGEERLLSYAVDLTTEVKAEDKLTHSPKMTVRVSDGVLQVAYTLRGTRTYLVRNRGKQARTLVIEHPIRAGWRLDDAMKPRERTRDLYRFDVPVKAGEAVRFDVHELQDRVDPFRRYAGKTSAVNDIVESHFDTNLLLDVDHTVKASPPELRGVTIVKGELRATMEHARDFTYRVRNQSADDTREITVEHQTPAGWQRVRGAKLVEGSGSFGWAAFKVAPGKAAEFTLTEEQTQTVPTRLAAIAPEAVAYYLAHPAVPAKVKEALKRLADQKTELTATLRQIEEIYKQLKEIADEQARLRQNLEKVPSSSEAYKRYVKKFDDQETQIETLQEQLKEKQVAAKAHQDRLDESFRGLSAE